MKSWKVVNRQGLKLDIVEAINEDDAANLYARGLGFESYIEARVLLGYGPQTWQMAGLRISQASEN